MIVVLRLIVFLFAAYLRLNWRASKRRPIGELDGRKLFVEFNRKAKSKELEGFRLGVELSASLLLTLHREQPGDRWFKALGLSREAQTGDDEFDCLVYVACDHAGMHELLQQSAALRAGDAPRAHRRLRGSRSRPSALLAVLRGATGERVEVTVSSGSLGLKWIDLRAASRGD